MEHFKVAILGNYNENYEPHYKMQLAFEDFQNSIAIKWIATETLSVNAADILNNYQGIVAASGPYQSKIGIINGIRYARENNIPFFGTCSGFGYAMLEFGQAIFNLNEVYHPYDNNEINQNELFLQPLNICSTEMQTISFSPIKGTLTDAVYKNQETVNEYSRCSYGISNHMVMEFNKNGLIVSGVDEQGEAKIMEYTANDFFLATLFYPQLKSNKDSPHNIILSFIEAILKQNSNKNLVII